MSTEDSFLKILQASAKLQSNIALILEAKAHEAEKTQNWILRHHTPGHFNNHHMNQLKNSLQFHEQIIELIDGLAKMENALARNLQIVLGGGASGSGPSEMGDFLNLNGDSQ